MNRQLQSNRKVINNRPMPRNQKIIFDNQWEQRELAMIKSQMYPLGYKIKPLHSMGDTPASVILRITGLAGNLLSKAVGVLVAVGATSVSFPYSLPLGFAAWKLGAAIQKSCDHWAELKDIQHLLSKQDMIAVTKLVGDGKYLSEKIKPYKTVGEIPPALQKELNNYINDNYKSIRSLKNAINEVEVVAKRRPSANVNISINQD